MKQRNCRAPAEERQQQKRTNSELVGFALIITEPNFDSKLKPSYLQPNVQKKKRNYASSCPCSSVTR